MTLEVRANHLGVMSTIPQLVEGPSGRLEEWPTPTVRRAAAPPRAPPPRDADTSRALSSSGAALFDSTFQGGPAVEVFGASGSNPTANWKVSGAVQRLYDKSVKGYVMRCEGGPSAKMQLPKDDRRSLGLVQPYLVLQIQVPAAKPFAMELSLSDAARSRRRVLFSTSFREASRTPLHTRVPLNRLRFAKESTTS